MSLLHAPWAGPRVERNLRIMPVLADQTPEQSEFARSAEAREFVRLVVRRDIPPAILDGALLDQMMLYLATYGEVTAAALRFKADKSASRAGRRAFAVCRAVFRNCVAMKARGIDLWAA